MNRRILTFHYTLRDERGRVLDTSQGSMPTPFIEGAGQIIDGLEESLLQMAVGEKRAVVVPPERGYGMHEEDLMQKVPKNRLPAENLQVGDQFQTGPDRHAPVVTVMAIEGDEVLLDANHPLAGRELHFDVELTSERAATAEELAAVRSEIID
jgi:FKBP-type peptidyl-prolyl cis-trans isomerase SlyD